jgi:hypothetical protein
VRAGSVFPLDREFQLELFETVATQ